MSVELVVVLSLLVRGRSHSKSGSALDDRREVLQFSESLGEGIFRFLADGRLEINTATGYDARPVEFLTGYDLTMLTLRRAD